MQFAPHAPFCVSNCYAPTGGLTIGGLGAKLLTRLKIHGAQPWLYASRRRTLRTVNFMASPRRVQCVTNWRFSLVDTIISWSGRNRPPFAKSAGATDRSLNVTRTSRTWDLVITASSVARRTTNIDPSRNG